MKFQLNDYTSQLAVVNAIAFMPEWGKTATSATFLRLYDIVADLYGNINPVILIVIP